MDTIISFIFSVNKISLVAFVGVLGFLIYEVLLLRKEQLKKQKPLIPQFNTSAVINKTVIQQQAALMATPLKIIQEKRTKASPTLAIVLIVMILFILAVSMYLMFLTNKQKTFQTNEPKVIIQEISSPGLKVFSTDWVEITEKSSGIKLLTPGTKVYVGIQTIDEADIDRARIKINENTWNITHITSQFNKDKKVYYREYTIATGESKLKIDAQLHSETDGWLGD